MPTQADVALGNDPEHMCLQRQMLHLPVTLNPKEMVGDLSGVVLLPTLPYTPSLSTL